MRAVFCSLPIFAAILVGPTASFGAPALRGVMHQWRTEQRSVQAMLSAPSSSNDQKLRSALAAYANDAGRIGAAVNARTAAARDIKRRFLAFQVDAQTALGHAGQKPALKTDVARLMADCRSCHHIYNN